MLTFLSRGSRPSQEDFVLSNPQKGIFAVADGFGGAHAGSLAAKTACEETEKFLFKEVGDLDATLPFVLRSYFSLAGNVLFNALIHANRKVIALNREKNVHQKGGASMIAGFLDGNLLAIANVGVCSATLIRKQETQRLITPRNFGRLVDPFLDGGSDAPLMALGMSDDLEPEIIECRIQSGDWLMLHSDGVDESFIGSLANLSISCQDFEIKQLFEAQNFSDNAALVIVKL